MLSVQTHEGLTLPVLDVTDPSFAVALSEDELAVKTEQFIREAAGRKLSPDVMEVLKQSRLGAALMAASGGVFGGLHTYLLKLGGQNLGDWATPVDRAIADSFPAFATRLRLQDTARFIGDAVTAGATDRLVRLINIGGGPAADSWNALLLVRQRSPELAVNRRFVISVFDPDEEGPALGKRALAVLTSSGAPLDGVDVQLEHVPYDWSRADELRQALGRMDAMHAQCVCSSEGAVFEYGTDEEIVANLEAVRAATPADTVMAGSVTRAGEATRASQSVVVATKPRTLDQSRGLVERAGWAIQQVIERPFSYNVRLAVDQSVPPR